MKRALIIIVVLGFLALVTGIIILNINSKQNNGLSKNEAVNLINKSLNVDKKNIIFLTESPNTYRYEIKSNDEEKAGNYVIDKKTKQILKEYTASLNGSNSNKTTK